MKHSHFRGLRPLKHLRVVLAALLVLAGAAPAAAQGTYGQLPDPITTGDLTQLLDLYVHPTKEQHASIETLHDAYRERFKALREGDMEKFMAKMRTMQGGTLPRKEQMEDFMRTYERIGKQVAEIDDALFDSIASLLGEEKRTDVNRARDARARTRASSGMASSMSGGRLPPDLSALVLKLEMDPKDVAALQPALVVHEQRATVLLRDMAAQFSKAIRELYEELDKMGFGNLTEEDMASNPERMQELMSKMQEAYAKSMAKQAAKVTDLRELNDSTYRALQPQVPEKHRRKLRVRYITASYAQLGEDPAGVERLFLRAFRSASLENAAREQLTAAYEQWQAADDAIVDQAVKFFGANDSRLAFAFNPEAYSEYSKKSQAFMEKRNEAAKRVAESVETLLGKERVARLAAFVSKSKGDIFDETGDADAVDPAAEATKAAATKRAAETMAWHTGGPESNGPASSETMAGLTSQLALDEAQKSLVETIYQDYKARWDEAVKPIAARIAAANRGMWAHDDASGSTRLDQSKQAAYFEARRESLAKARELDDALFADLASALGDSARPAVMLTKLRSQLDRGNAPSYGSMAYSGMGMHVEESAVNVATVLQDQSLTAEERTQVWKAIEPKVDAILKAVLDSQTSMMETEREGQLLSVRSAELYKDGQQPDMVEAQRISQSYMAMQQRSQQALARRNDSVRDAWKAALESLPEQRRAALQQSYDELAFPSIYKDPRAATPLLKKALELDDLSPEQKSQVQALADQYRARHLEYCRQMQPKASATESSSSDPAQMQRYWQEQMERNNAREKVRFERDENSQRVVNQLKRLLNEAQATRLAGLATYGREETAQGYPQVQTIEDDE